MLNILFIIALIVFAIPTFIGFIYIMYLMDVYADEITKHKII